MHVQIAIVHSPGFAFCSGCGAAANDPEITRIARTQGSASLEQAGPGEMEHTIFSVRPTLIFIKLGYLLAVLGGIALVVLLALIPVSPLISVPLGLALLLIPAYFHLKRNMIRYTLTDAKMEIDTGLVARTTRNIPLSKIQDVTVSARFRTPTGFGDLIVDNASEERRS